MSKRDTASGPIATAANSPAGPSGNVGLALPFSRPVAVIGAAGAPLMDGARATVDCPVLEGLVSDEALEAATEEVDVTGALGEAVQAVNASDKAAAAATAVEFRRLRFGMSGSVSRSHCASCVC
jgi:hypothetical protein